MSAVVASRELNWPRPSLNGMMTAPKWRELTGFVSFARAACGKSGRMWIGGSSKIARTAEGSVCPISPLLVPALPA